MIHQDARLTLEPYEYAAAHRLAAELGVSSVLAQVLVRRGMGEPAAARAFLAAADEHPLDAFGGLREAAERILGHVRRRTRITVHGDYDVDGVCASAVLIRALRTLGADVDWYLPSRASDGYGLAAATVDRLAARGTDLLVTVDCAITAVEEVARARAAGMDVIVTDHHSPRADGALPDAPIVHPRIGGYPCADLCAAAVAHKLAQALLAASGEDPRMADEDLDLVALATVADVVPLLGENRRLVREGLRALASTRKPGLRALMDVAKVDPSTIDAGAIGFRLGPRLNAAGRLYRADAGLELLLTEDRERARAVALELDANNTERRDVETRIRFEAEAQVAEQGSAAAYVLASDGWHAGVIGIVAARIAERHHRPCVLIALDGEEGTGSGRSIPRFDLLGGLHASSETLQRYGGHRAAAGLTIAARRRPGLPRGVRRPRRERPRTRGPAAGGPRRRRRARATRSRSRSPRSSSSSPRSARATPPSRCSSRPRCSTTRGRWGRAATSRSRSPRAAPARAACCSAPARGCPAEPGEPVGAVVRLERNHWNGTTEPRLILRHAQRATQPPIEVLGEPAFMHGLQRELAGTSTAGPPDRRDPDRGLVDRRRSRPGDPGGEREVRARRPRSRASPACSPTWSRAASRCSPSPRTRPIGRAACGDRVGGFAICSWQALEDDPALAAGFAHVVAVDPPAAPGARPSVRQRAGPIWRGASLSYALLHVFINGTSPCATRWRPSTARSARRGTPEGRPVRHCSGARGRNPGPRRWPAAWCGSSRSSTSWTSTARGRPSGPSRRPSGPRSSARPPSGPTIDALRTDSDS